MTSRRVATSVAIGTAAVLLVTGTAARVASAATSAALVTDSSVVTAATGPAVDPAVTPTTNHGGAFLIQSQLDRNYCIQVDAGATPGRALSLQQCNSTLPTQRWTFTWNSDQSNLLVDDQGMCVQGRKPQVGVPMTVDYCRFGSVYKFVYTSEGLIENVLTGQCLSIARAGSAAAVFFRPCDPTQKTDVWPISL